MLGTYLRSKIALVLAILGLLVLGLGIGQRTIWLPPATITAGVTAPVKGAPLTVIGPDVLNAKGGQFTMTIKSSGPIQLAVGQLRDVMGWVGDAAYTNVTGVNPEFTSLTTVSKAGAEKVPNPAGSDMWVSEEKGTGELSYTWQVPGHGDWALLLSSDGTAPAPTNISLTADNDASTPWAVPLMIVGSALLALAALLFFMAPRKKAPLEAAAGRRSAVRGPSDPATGTLEVERILAARNGAASGPATIAETSATPVVPANEEPRDAQARTSQIPAAAALPKVLGHDSPESAGTEITLDGSTAGKEQPADKPSPAGKSKDKSDAKDQDKSDTPDDNDTTGGGTSGQTAAPKDTVKKKKSPGEGKAERRAEPAQPGAKSRLGVKARWGAAMAAVLVAGTVSPALAAETTPAPTPTAATTASASASASASSTAPATELVPTLLGSQVDRITSAVANVVASGDSAKNAKELAPRVTGMALNVRAANYQIRSKDAKYAAPEPVSSTKLLTQVVSTTPTWPRTAIVVTQGEKNPLPQLLTLVQQAPRDDYKLSKQSPLLPGQTFPKVDKERVTNLPLASSEGLLMSPNEAIAALSDVLTKTDSKFKGSFNDSVYIKDVATYRSSTLAKSKDANVVFSHTADDKTTAAMSTSDGGALVVVGYLFGVDSTPKNDATSKLTDPSVIALAGGTESNKGIVITYGEPVVMYIPPASAKGKITITSATRDLISAKIK